MFSGTQTHGPNRQLFNRWLIPALWFMLMLVSCAPAEAPTLDVRSTKVSPPAPLVVTPQAIQTATPTVPTIQTSPPGTPGKEEIVKPSDSQPAPQPLPSPTLTLPGTPSLLLTTAEDAILAVQSQFPAVADISDMPDTTIGKSEDIYALPQENGWRLVFWRGWGDCPAGCINSHYWYFFVKTDGVIELVGEYERVYEPRLNTYRETGEPLWGVPR